MAVADSPLCISFFDVSASIASSLASTVITGGADADAVGCVAVDDDSF